MIYGTTLLLSVGLLGCLEGAETGDTGGSGGTMIFEPGPTCTAFCAQAVGECGVAQLGDDADCKQNCELERSFAEQTSADCLESFEASVDCAAALDCQDIVDRVNEVDPDAYPCLPEVEDTVRLCSAG